MTNQASDGGALINMIIELSEQAIKFHGKMSGYPMIEESFIRDFVAIRLFEGKKFGVTLETGKEIFKDAVTNEIKHSDHDLLSLGGYLLDMIIWENDEARAIVEFKRSLEVLSDIQRIASLLSVSEGLSGYSVVACVFRRSSQFEKFAMIFDERTKAYRLGDVLKRGPSKVFDEDDAARGESWCGILAVEVRTASESAIAP